MPDALTKADAVRLYASGAESTGGWLQSVRDALGGHRSMMECLPLQFRRITPIPGLRILYVSGENGVGSGTLRADGASTLYWTAPGGTEGSGVSVANGETKIIESSDATKYVRVERVSANALDGTETLQLAYIANNLLGGPNAVNAEAVGGNGKYCAGFLVNLSSESITNLKFCIGTADKQMSAGKETPVSGAIQSITDADTEPTGITWNTGTTFGTGVSVGTLAPGESVGVWIERELVADTQAGAWFREEIRWQWTGTGGATFTNRISGLFAVHRDDAECWGIWIGQDELPDGDAAPDETFSTTPHTTTLTLTAGHTYQWFIRKRATNGLWEQSYDLGAPIVVNGDGSEGDVAPSAPQDITVVPTSAGKVRVRCTYYPTEDGAAAAEIFAIYAALGADPIPGTDTPVGYQTMQGGNIAIETMDKTPDTTYIDQGPVHVIPVARRIIEAAGRESCEDAQLGASGGGTLETTDGDYSGFDSTGYIKIMTAMGRLREYCSYSANSGTALTVPSGGRGLWGSTAQSGEETDIVVQVRYKDSENTTATIATMDLLSANRPSGRVMVGAYGMNNDLATPPTGTPIYADDDEDGFYWENRAGDARLYEPGGDLVLRVLFNSENPTASCIYLSGYESIGDTVSGAAVSVEEHADTYTKLYISVNGVRRMLVDRTAKTITTPSIDGTQTMPIVYPQVPVWPRYADTLLTVWDPATENYVPWAKLAADGTLGFAINIDATKDEAAILALSVP